MLQCCTCSVAGKAAVTSVLGMASNLECLLPFVEHAGKEKRSQMLDLIRPELL